MIGNRIRHERLTQQRSLADVAAKAGVSVATLSRIENSKQALDLQLFLRLAAILKIAAARLLSEEGDGDATVPLARRLAELGPSERAKLWRQMAATRRQHPPTLRKRPIQQIALQVEELLAQVEFLRAELDGVRKRIRVAPARRARVTAP